MPFFHQVKDMGFMCGGLRYTRSRVLLGFSYYRPTGQWAIFALDRAILSNKPIIR